MNELNLMAIYMSNMIGVILTIVLLLSSIWRLREKRTENMLLIALILITLVSCIADPLASAINGRVGVLYKIVNYVLNTWLFASNTVAPVIWISFLSYHITGSFSKKHLTVLLSLCGASIAILVVNFFVPLAFSIDEAYKYCRGPLFFAFFAIDIGVLIDSLILYFVLRRKASNLMSFPVWVFISPAIIGGVVQSLFIGISVIWPCIAVSEAGIFAAMQNELIFRDKLTGLYNRFYLEQVFGSRKSDSKYIVLMLDLNRFKHINDTYGHAEGDQAIIDAANILRSTVGAMGICLRFAGDEFLVVLNTSNIYVADGVSKRITNAFEVHNNTAGRKYYLSASIGSVIYDPKQQSLDEMLNNVDKKMYESKNKFYINEFSS